MLRHYMLAASTFPPRGSTIVFSGSLIKIIGPRDMSPPNVYEQLRGQVLCSILKEYYIHDVMFYAAIFERVIMIFIGTFA